ncbi:hypothetical protein HDU98_003933 [Podochytrium sp. JEL0797]|nr:hypothetical protein HDU98_003933 [Podochytrium sp. JEL0797]
MSNDCQIVGQALGIVIGSDCCTTGAGGLVICTGGRVSTLNALCSGPGSQQPWYAKSFSPLIGQLSGLQTLFFDNCGLIGPLPDVFGGFYLQELHLQGNSLSGTLPPSFSQMLYMNFFHIQNNNFIGPLPTGISNWKSIQVAELQGNCLTGSSPNPSISLGTQRTNCAAPPAVVGVGKGGANVPGALPTTAAAHPPDAGTNPQTTDAGAPPPPSDGPVTSPPPTDASGTSTPPTLTAPIVNGLPPPPTAKKTAAAAPSIAAIAAAAVTTTAPAPASPAATDSMNVPLVAGIAGGVSALILIAIAIVCCIRRKSRARREEEEMYAPKEEYYRDDVYRGEKRGGSRGGSRGGYNDGVGGAERVRDVSHTHGGGERDRSRVRRNEDGYDSRMKSESRGYSDRDRDARRSPGGARGESRGRDQSRTRKEERGGARQGGGRDERGGRDDRRNRY